MAAKAPSRSSGSLTIQFGLVTVPVAVYSGTEETRVSRKQFSPAGNPISMKRVDSETGEAVEYGDVVKKATATDGTQVPFSDDEAAAAVTMENGDCEVVGFVDRAHLDQYVTKDVYQVRPAKGGNKKPVAAFEKAFVLLAEAMVDTDTVALLRWAQRGTEKFGALTPTGDLLVFYFADEVRERRPLPQVETSEAERAMAAQLLESMRVTEPPAVTDETSAKVQAAVDAKAKGVTVEAPDAPAPDESTDLMAALQASLAAAKA